MLTNMERSRNKHSSKLLWATLVVLLTQNLVIPVASSVSFDDRKNYYSPDPHTPDTPPSSLAPPSHGHRPPTPSHQPPYHGGGTPPTTNCGCHSGGGHHHHTPSPPSGVGYYDPPPSSTPTTPTTPTPITPTPTTPSPPSGGGYYDPPPSSTPTTPTTPTPITPSPPSGGGYYDPPPSSAPTPTPTTPSPPSGGGYYEPPPSSTPTTPTTPTPTIFTPPATPIDPGTGTPTIPSPPYAFNPNSPPFTCNYWRTHPGLVWGLVGWWGTVGGAFGLTSLPGLGSNTNLLQALSNPRTDGLGALYREGTAALLNSMVNKGFPYTTRQVRDSFAAALDSNKAAAAQAKLFKQANEGRAKPRA